MKLTTRLFIRSLFVCVLCVSGLFSLALAAQSNQLKGVRAWPSPDNTRVVLDLSSKPSYETHYLKHPDRLVIDLKSTSSKVNLKKIVNDGPLVKGLRESASGKTGTYRLVVDLNKASKAKIFSLPPAKPYGHRLVVDLPHGRLSKPAAKPQVSSTPAGRDVIVAIDAGHGGDDPGALGKYTYEKKITLQIAKRLQKKINAQKGMSAFLIRTGDYFVNLNKRSSIARKGKADFLVSIHADGFTSSQPRGASVWVLSKRRATTEQGRWMENHEARSELIGGTGDMMQDSSNMPYFQKMVLDMSMDKSMDVGYKVGDLVVKELKQVTKLHKKKPVHASLAVLKSPDIPSILVEAGFITNRSEERLLNQAEHQNKIANAVFKGIYKHFTRSPLHDTLFAQKKRAIKHTVRSGESLSILAQRYSVSSKQLKEYNNLRSNSLRTGQVLDIPPDYQLVVKHEPARQATAVKQEARTHKVKRGESLSVIAAKYNSSAGALKSFNNLRSTSLAIGQKIKIPGGYVVTTQLAGSPSTAYQPERVHRVRSGESLSVIAAKYDSSSSELKSYNKLRSTSLAIGQKIKIPGTGPAVQTAQAAPKAVVNKPLVHKVKSGESLSVIAAKYGSSSRELKSYNKLRSTSLAIGQKIKIPGTGPAVQTAQAAPKAVVNKPFVHKVKSGESLSLIASKYGSSTSELKSYNKLRSTSLRIGQKIKIPGMSSTAQSAQAPSKVVVNKPLVHKVRSGESLSLIASKYGSSTSELKSYNKLRSTSLRIGQKIRIPGDNSIAKQSSQSKPQVHKVRSGESLSVIAKRYGKTTSELKNYNKLRSTSLRIGQKIRIPGGSAAKQAVQSKPQVHKVRSGESLSVIAKRYGKSTRELKSYNNLSSTSLRIGQKIKIPGAGYAAVKKQQPKVHLVKSGESLSVIASRYGTSSSVLKNYNKLSSTSLRIGQKIKIPASGRQPTRHKVRSGESLSVIAKRYGTTTSAIKISNKLSSNSLAIGQVLTIPVT